LSSEKDFLPKKIGLGSVQFGQAYGVSNTRGKVPAVDVAAILELAYRSGVSLLDTAPSYDVETTLSNLDLTPFRIVTKTILLKNGLEAVVARARQSAKTLKADTLLVHAARDLAGPDGDAYWHALQVLRDEGIFRKIGISVYAADGPYDLARRFKPDVMQIPLSLLDQRLLVDGTLARLKDADIEIHARSIFLQGLLFMETPPEKLRHAGPHLKLVRARIAEAGTTPIAAAIGFVLSRPEIDFALVGVTSLADLRGILGAAECPLPDMDWRCLAFKDELILTPSLW
jgi:aryl-alcohol dehydrogenase-like predicted oxidoreductase